MLEKSSDKSYFRIFYKVIFFKNKNAVPSEKIYSKQTDLSSILNNSMVWLGHSYYFFHLEGKSVVIDPIFHEDSPVSFMMKPFSMVYDYTSDDIPKVDLLIITHDH